MKWDNIVRHTYDFGDRQITFRSGWELHYAFYLEWLKKIKEIKAWEYEPERYFFYITEGNTKIRLDNGYLPDFRVTNNDGTQYLVEIKGKKQGTRKLQRMKKHYPHIKLELIQAKEYNDIKRKVGKLLNFV